MLAGQIGLVPHCMTLADEDTQPSLALTHIQKVMAANGTELKMALGGVCYCTCFQSLCLARQAWKSVSWWWLLSVWNLIDCVDYRQSAMRWVDVAALWPSSWFPVFPEERSWNGILFLYLSPWNTRCHLTNQSVHYLFELPLSAFFITTILCIASSFIFLFAFEKYHV